MPVMNPLPLSAAATKSPPVAVTVKPTKLEFFTPLKARGPVGTDKVYRVGGMSSQPWANMIGSHPGYSAFASPETALQGFELVSIGGTYQH